MRKPSELAVLIEVAAWREREAQARDVPRGRVLKDDVIGDIAIQAPTTIERLGALRSLPKGFERSQWGEAIVDAVKRGLARDPKTLPRLERSEPAVNGQATVELLKVLLRMTAERHGVAAKVIATVDDLERIAADDEADVPALQGWRRELFGEKALALKHGRLSLAIDRGRVVAAELTHRERSGRPSAAGGLAEIRSLCLRVQTERPHGRLPSKPVVHRRDLSGARQEPLARTICNEPLGAVSRRRGVAALTDRCPHRKAPLSSGEVVGNDIQCGYHGLRFAPDGACTHVPGARRSAAISVPAASRCAKCMG